MNNSKRFEEITKSMLETYIAKNSDYGDSFGETCNEFGFVAAATRMCDKMNRIKQFAKSNIFKVSESVKDTLLDLANYCILAYMWLENKEKDYD